MARAQRRTSAFEFSVIIPSYGGRDTVEWCLEGLAGQEGSIPFEVIVVESGEAGYVDALAERFEWARFVISPERLYSGQARNVGAGFAAGETLIFLDADCRPLPGWLAAFKAGRDRGFGVVSGSLANGNPESGVGTAEYLVSHSSYSPAMGPRVITDSTAASGNLLVLRRVFDDKGGFAGTMRANDFLFSRKLHESGERILFWPQAAALHLDNIGFRDYVSGQVARGRWNGMARLEHGLAGSAAGRFPPLAFLLFPVRLYRLVRRCLEHGIVPAGELALRMPSVAAGVLAWTWGFFEATLRMKKGGLEERDPLPVGWAEYTVVSAGGDGR